MADLLSPFASAGVKAWFPDKERGWISAELTKNTSGTNGAVSLEFVDENGKTHTVKTTVAEVESSKGEVLPPLRNPPLLEATDDLTNLSYLNEPAVLHTILNRYSQRLIYTYSGIVLIAVNPFQAVTLYEQNIIQAYSGKRKGELEPHLFAIAEDAYRCMIRDRRDQTIVVSGESGAGKTVSAKYIMRYFATVDDPERPGKRRPGAAGKDASGMSEVEQQILATNPIMEAFGNAKTTRNDNSSRFGKYIEILFDKSQEIVGAKMRTYLLERSRLNYQPETERNYHIFYQLCAGAPSSERKSLGLRPASEFNYLNQGGESSLTINGVDDVEEFKTTQKALSTVGITIERQWHIFRLLAALLHLGNVKVTQTRNDAFVAEDDAALLLATNLLGIDAAEFRRWLVKKQIQMRSEKIVSSLTGAQAAVVRDSVAKYIYSSLFDFLVATVNESLVAGPDIDVESFIGVLDIYGFEHFKKNSFEQFCINFANEKLQQEFNSHVFKLEQAEYMREEINWTFIDFSDNQPCIDLIEGKLGILSLLDEESRLPSGADSTFLQKLYTQFDKRPEYKKVFKKPRFGTTAFTVAHYALDVTYETEGFIEKNRDTVPDEHLALLNNTTNSFLKEVLDRAVAVGNASKHDSIAASLPSEDGGPTTVSKRASMLMDGGNKPGLRKAGGVMKKPTLGSIFKGSLISLMDTIDSTNVHYIRCIKPNESKKAWEFEPQQVLGQLRACGVLETIRISCAGYPSRWTFAEFAERYYMLVNSSNWGMADIKDLSTFILRQTIKDEDKYQVGLTKIFFRAGMLAFLEAKRSDRLNYLVTIIQKNLRRYIEQKHYNTMRSAAIVIQAWWRGILARRFAESVRKETFATKLQVAARGYLQMRNFRSARQAIVRIQSIARGWSVRSKFGQQKTHLAATRLQSLIRGCLVRRRVHHDKKKIIYLQSCYRRRLAKRELAALRTEARSVSHYQDVSYKLENKVVELTQNLQKRTKENKELGAKIRSLEQQLNIWQAKHEELDSKAKGLQAEIAKPTVPLSEFEELERAKEELDRRYKESSRRITEQDNRISQLMADMEKQSQEMEAKAKAITGQQEVSASDAETITNLRAEVASIREQLNRANALNALQKNSNRADNAQPPVFNMATGQNGFTTSKRRPRRHSDATAIENGPAERDSTDEMLMAVKRSAANANRHVSVAFGPDGGQAGFRSPGGRPYKNEYDDPSEEIIKILEAEEMLDEDVLFGLIRNLRIPAPSLTNPPSPKEVLFPAHLISLVTNEMWKYGLVRESERFLANVMQTIQQHVMSFQGDDAIVPGIFWLSNVHEVLSFVCIAESDMLQGIGPGVDGAARSFEWGDYERLVTIVKHDLDSLEYNIYHTWMQEAKKRLHKMVIPALVESQSLPGFVTSDSGGRLFNRLLSGASTPAYTMDDILGILNRVWKSLKSYYVEQSVVQQVVTELLKLIGVTSFNDLLMRRNFCSWKRAMQIQYNITRIEEWCKSHDMPEGTLNLEHLMQATKLLQLKKATLNDIDIIYDVCWILTPTQIQKLISHYYVADYENPISPEILKAVASRVVPNDRNDHLLLPPEVDEAGPYELPLPREVTGIETYVPSYLQVPHIRRLALTVA